MPISTPEGTPLFAEGAAGTLRLVGYLLLALVLMVADYRGQYLGQLRNYASTLAGPVYWLASAPMRLARGVRDSVVERRDLAQQNTTLRRELMLAQARLTRLAAVQDQNTRLRELLDARTRLGLKVQLAELLDVDLDPFRHRLLLNVGTQQDVHEGQAVIDADGVLGQVLDSSSDRSTLVLITDASHALPVRVVRTGLRTIAYGSGDVATLRLPHIPFSADVKPGDQLITSGVGGHFPAGLPVGVVREVTPDDSATFVLALATPSAGITRSGEVLLLYDERETLHQPGGSGYEFVGPPEAMAVTTPTETPSSDTPGAAR